jgi:outer membrane protein assembly factor BamB/predicted phosphohydrolase
MTACLLALLLQVLPLRFAWLSDLHVGSDGAAHALETAVSQLNQRDDIGFVLLSGDITEMGSTEELTVARQILGKLRHPYHIIPGNHDTKWSESGTTAFPKLFGSDRFLARHGAYAFLGIHQGPVMRMADGHCSPQDLRWADSVLYVLRQTRTPVIIVAHYPMDSSVVNWYELLDRLDSNDVRLFLVGHGHQNEVLSFEGYPGVMCRALLNGRGHDPGYNIVTISGDSLDVRAHHGTLTESIPWCSMRLNPVRHSAGSFSRPDFSINTQYPHVRVAWKWNCGYTITSAPAYGEGVAVVGDASGAVHCLRAADGVLLWTHMTGGPVLATPAIAEGRVIVTSADCTIRCLDAATGRRLWQYKEGASVVAAPAVHDGRAFVGGSDGKFRALDLSTGREHWCHDSIAGFVETKPLIHEGLVLFGAWGEKFYALDENSGALRWQWQGPRRSRLFSPAACWPVASGKRLFFVAPDRAMTVLNCLTGAEIWRSTSHQVRESIGMTSDSTLVLVRTMRDSLIAFDARADRRIERWVGTPGFGYEINAAMPVEKGGTVLYGSQRGMIYALEAANGNLRWSYRVGAVTLNTLAPVDAHTVLVTDFDGNVMLLGEDKDE